ncbi:MAG: YfhO family protein [Bacteroidales bacterium]|jgi:hypothetical protein|nr:YfhO family protein [Bacteroidales bacterium]
MNKNIVKLIFKHVAAIAFLAIVSLFYFSPLMEGKDVRQSDMIHSEGMSKEAKDYHEKTGEYTQWANNQFSGMPTALTYGKPAPNVFHWISKIIQETVPPLSYGPMLMMLICCYLTMIFLGFDIFIAIGAALAFAFCSYNLIIIEAGHVTKAYAIATMPMVLGGLILAYKNKLKAGGLLFLFGLGLNIAQSHPQITYYTAIAAAIWVVIALIVALKNSQFLQFLKTSVLILLLTILAVLPNLSGLFITYDYSKQTMRSPSELLKNADTNVQKSTGLDYDYAYSWSYGLGETFTLLVPNVYGGGSHFEKFEQYEKLMPNTLQTLKTQRFEQDPNQLLQQCSPYWGAQPFTSGPVYAGAVICLLFVLSLFVIKGSVKWWIIGVFAVSIVMAWGKHFPAINDFLFYHLPMYNKFRTPSMILVLTTTIMAMSGFWGLKLLLFDKIEKQKAFKYLYISVAIVGFFCLIFALMPSVCLDFAAASDAGLPSALVSALQEDRANLCSSDAWRSLGFIVVAAVILWLFIFRCYQNNSKSDITNVKKAKSGTKSITTSPNYVWNVVVVVAISLWALIDLWNIDKRYLNNDDFEKPANTIAQNYPLRPVNSLILKDTTVGYRVLNLAASPWNDSHTPYYHHSVGGYHPAKMRRYQEMVDSVFTAEIQRFISNINTVTSDSQRIALLQSLPAINMLNTKYFIFNYDAPPFENSQALGAAWFVDSIEVAQNANQELQLLQALHPLQAAVMSKDFYAQVKDFQPVKSPNSTIELTQQTPNTCVYHTKTDKTELAVFSEIYYPKFWHVDIDGKPAQLLRANYILRAMCVPAGEHTITFRFYPDSWEAMGTVSLIASVIIILLTAGIIVYTFWKKKKNNV